MLKKNRHLPKTMLLIHCLSTIYQNKANSLFPIGDYKGYGLGATVEVFCSILLDAIWNSSLPMLHQCISKKDLYHSFILSERLFFK